MVIQCHHVCESDDRVDSRSCNYGFDELEQSFSPRLETRMETFMEPQYIGDAACAQLTGSERLGDSEFGMSLVAKWNRGHYFVPFSALTNLIFGS